MTAPTCPTCGKVRAPRAENPAFPFCGARCKTVDLGKWLGEEYRVSATVSDGEFSEGASVPPEDSGA